VDGGDEVEELLENAGSEWNTDGSRAGRSAAGGDGESRGIRGSRGEGGVVDLGGDVDGGGDDGGGDSHGGVSVPVLSDIRVASGGEALEGPVLGVLVVNVGGTLVGGGGAVGGDGSSSTWWDWDLGLLARVVEDQVRGDGGSIAEGQGLDGVSSGDGVGTGAVVGGV